MRKIVTFIFLLFVMTGCSYSTTTKDVYQIDDQVTEVVSKVEDSTVMIITKFNSRSLALGSGVIYNKRESSYFVLTNAHVVSSGNKFEVVLNNSTYVAKMIYINISDDLAILQITSLKELPIVELGNYNDLQKGQSVIAIGTPLKSNYYNTVTTGRITGIREGKLQHDAAINPGNSGGPLVDLTGKLIGINTSKIVYASTNFPAEKMGFAIDLNIINETIKNDTNEEEIIKNSLGLEYISLKEYVYTYPDTSFIPADLTYGLVILSVDTLHSQLLYKNDIIVEMNNKKIEDEEDYLTELWSLKNGDVIKFKLYRNLALITVEITL